MTCKQIRSLQISPKYLQTDANAVNFCSSESMIGMSNCIFSQTSDSQFEYWSADFFLPLVFLCEFFSSLFQIKCYHLALTLYCCSRVLFQSRLVYLVTQDVLYSSTFLIFKALHVQLVETCVLVSSYTTVQGRNKNMFHFELDQYY